MSNKSSVTYTIICENQPDMTITIDDNTTVREALFLINSKLGEDPESEPPKKTSKKIKFDMPKDYKEEIEIFGLSNYTDRSTKFNTIKFPGNQLIVFEVSNKKMFIRSSRFVRIPDKGSDIQKTAPADLVE